MAQYRVVLLSVMKLRDVRHRLLCTCEKLSWMPCNRGWWYGSEFVRALAGLSGHIHYKKMVSKYV